MNHQIYLFKKTKNCISALLIAAIITVPAMPAVAAAELPVKVYAGANNAREIIQNITFNDISGTPATYWAKDAIYEVSALEAIKGFGDRSFRPASALSKEEALALIYRMLGRENEAQKAAEVLDATRSRDMKKQDAVAYWSDGYLQLAVNDGLITQSDFQVAMQKFQPKPGSKNRFVKADPAQRQEVAYWVAKAAKLQPLYEQQNIFNSFNDWKQTDPPKVPYIEAVLQNKIMNGKPNALFDPKGSVTREQMAQIMKNMENVVFPTRKLERKNGYIEEIYTDNVEKQGGGVSNTVLKIRGDDGKLYNITRTVSQENALDKNKEFSPGEKIPWERELVVYKNGKLSAGDVLEEKDQLEYIADSNNVVKYIKATPASMGIKESQAEIIGADVTQNTITVRDSNGNTSTYSVKDGAEILNNGKLISLAEIPADRDANLWVQNNLIIKLEVKWASPGGEEKNINGIVEDNSPALNYISLYDEGGARAKSTLRTFYYKPDVVNVQKDGKQAELGDIQPGDTVYIKLDGAGSITDISGSSNYEPVYGKIVLKQPSSLAVELDNGTQQVLPVADDVLVFNSNEVVPYDSLKEGDDVRMLLQKTPDLAKIKEITTQTYVQGISNVYKGELEEIDTASGKLNIRHPEKLYKGSWERDSQIGFLGLNLDENAKVYSEGKPLDIEKAAKEMVGKELYAAVKRSFGNEEEVEFISFRNPSSTEVVYDDTIASVDSGANKITLDKTYGAVGIGEGTIVVKDENLVSGRSLEAGDPVYVAANKSADTGAVEAGVVMAVRKPDLNLVQIYRGKLGSINNNKDFTLDNFATLDGLTWEYSGFPKTFSMTFDTRLINDGGVASVRDFTAGSDYIGNPVYVVSDGSEALLVSTAPYGAFNARGEIVSIPADFADESTSGTSQSGQTGTTETTGAGKIKLLNASVYDSSTGQWVSKDAMELGILSSTIIIKNGELVTPDRIERGDMIRVLKKDDTAAGDAYLILVEK